MSKSRTDTYSASSYAFRATGRHDTTPFRPEVDKVSKIVSLISSLVAPSFLAIGTWNDMARSSPKAHLMPI